MPAEGTRELRLSNGFTIAPSYGMGFAQLAPEHGSNMTTLSFRVGAGYFVAQHVEVGGMVGYYYLSSGGSSSTVQGPGLDAFLRLYSRTGNLGLFFEPILEFQYLSFSNGSDKVLGPGADIGIEFFLADSWALRFSPTFRYYKLWESADSGGSADTSATRFGLSLGISAYF
jgi:hypothetical protein